MKDDQSQEWQNALYKRMSNKVATTFLLLDKLYRRNFILTYKQLYS